MINPKNYPLPRWHDPLIRLIQSQSAMALSLTIVLLLSWGSTLGILLAVPIGAISVIWLAVAILGRTFLHTGLFILAHDAMHQNLLPHHPQLNHRLGQLCVRLYAFLSYHQCRINHIKHHQIPAQVGDPDFHDGIHSQPLWWYLNFLRGYLSFGGFSRFTVGWVMILTIGHFALHLALLNLLLFWMLPLILSSTQLFVFGTYLPHRHGIAAPQTTHHPAQFFWSLLSCYHFGQYHWEHHTYPKTPWYQLPQANKQAPSLPPIA